MKLTYFQPPDTRNFGDALNAFVWPRLLPAGFLDSDDAELFVGIGSIIFDTYPATSRKFVVGSGYGGYTSAPDLMDGSWNIVFVRGPQTASMLGLPNDSWITDGAVLLREVGDLPAPTPNIGVGFMPHFESLAKGNWEDVCGEAGVSLIDPRKPVQSVLADILGARLILAEAMHGAIVADCLRIPWVPIRPLSGAHHMKWSDWTASLDLSPDWTKMGSSSLNELLRNNVHRRGVNFLERALRSSGTLAAADGLFRRRAARMLKDATRARPFLSTDAVIRDRTGRAKSALDRFVEQHAR